MCKGLGIDKNYDDDDDNNDKAPFHDKVEHNSESADNRPRCDTRAFNGGSHQRGLYPFIVVNSCEHRRTTMNE